jgi:hypothetical protein
MSDVKSVNAVRLNIEFEITYSTTVVEFNTTMALVVLMERCNFFSAGTETTDSSETTVMLRKRASWLAVKKLDCQAYNWRLGSDVLEKFPAKKLRI